MKRSDLLIRIISGVIFVALVFYIGYYFFDSRANSFKTVLATEYSIEDGIHTEGCFVKDETLLYGDTARTAAIAEEGEKLAAYDAYAVLYADSGAMERASKIRSLELEIQQVEALIGTSAAKDRTSSAVLDFSYAVNSGDFSNLDEASMGVKTYILGENAEYGDEKLNERLSELKNELALVTSSAGSDTSVIVTDTPGTFSMAVDGFENISLDDAKKLTPEKIESVLNAESTKGSTALGKLITGTGWYYAAVVDADDTKEPKVGEEAELSFVSVFDEPVSLTVESIGPNHDGKCAVLFSGSKYFYKVAAARQSKAVIIFESYSGIKVPKEAVYKDEEGNDVVYVVTGLQASEKRIEILTEADGFYLVSGGGESELRLGDEMIVTKSEMHDGKVIL